MSEPFIRKGGDDGDKAIQETTLKYVLIPTLTSFTTFSELFLVLFLFYLFMIFYIYITSYEKNYFSYFTMFIDFFMNRPNNSQQKFKEYIEHLVEDSMQPSSNKESFSTLKEADAGTGRTTAHTVARTTARTTTPTSTVTDKIRTKLDQWWFNTFYIKGKTLKLKNTQNI